MAVPIYIPTNNVLLSHYSRGPTLCDPIDGVPGILQARTLEWAAISSSNAWKWKVKVKSLSRVRLLATPLTAAYHGIFQARVLEWGAIAFSVNQLWNHLIFSVSSGLSPCFQYGPPTFSNAWYPNIRIFPFLPLQTIPQSWDMEEYSVDRVGAAIKKVKTLPLT